MAANEPTTGAVITLPGEGPLLLICEHGGNHIPARYKMTEVDRALQEAHWGYDLHAESLVRALSERLEAPAAMAMFSRLLIDPNRALDRYDLIPEHAHDIPIPLNANVSASERQYRIQTFYNAYHNQVTRLAAGKRLLFSIHSFTPDHPSGLRDDELGVLFDKDEAEAEHLCSALKAQGFRARLNWPYSGKDGLTYSVDSHAAQAGAKALEIEVRSDLIESATGVTRIADALHTSITPLLAPATTQST